jgi:thiamine biosynthesis protein ThiS
MIQVNNRNQEFEEHLTVNRLLKRNRFTYVGIIVKINNRVIEDDEYDAFLISDNDDVKVIHICHGG